MGKRMKLGILIAVFIQSSFAFGYNASCTTPHVGDNCEVECRELGYKCALACIDGLEKDNMTDPGVSTCKEGCYNDQFDCTYNCPCYKNCPLGCPCDTYPNCPDVTTTTKKTTTTSIWYPTSSTTIVTTTLGANTVCESFSGVFIGRDQHCYSILTTGAITPSSGSNRRNGMVINQEFMFTVEVYLKSYPQNTCQSIFFVGYNGHYPCQYDYNCLPQLRICNNDPNWDNVYGTWVDFGGGSKIQSRGFRKIPLKTWTRVTFYRKMLTNIRPLTMVIPTIAYIPRIPGQVAINIIAIARNIASNRSMDKSGTFTILTFTADC